MPVEVAVPMEAVAVEVPVEAAAAAVQVVAVAPVGASSGPAHPAAITLHHVAGFPV